MLTKTDSQQTAEATQKAPAQTSVETLSVEEKRALIARMMRERQAAANANTTAKPTRPKEAPLSPGQERMWFLQRLRPDNNAYNVPLSLELKGDVDRAALRRAFETLMQRHETLRTTFHEGAEGPIQRVHASMDLPFRVVDRSHMSHEEWDDECTRLAREQVSETIDLSSVPGWAVTVIVGPNAHRLEFVVHHIVFDDWSGGVFLRELRTVYDAHREGREANLPALPIQYAEYARWQRKRLQGDHLDRQLDYWRTHLKGNTPLELPADRPRPAVQTFRGAQEVAHLDTGLWNRLEDLARRHRVTPFMVLLAAYAVMLHRLSAQSTVTIGSPVAGRDRPETTRLIGFLLNMLAMKVDVGGEPSFAELLQRVRGVVTGAYAHQEIPFETLVQNLVPNRDLSRNPLFQASFVLLTFKASDFDMEADMKDAAHNDSAKFDLTLTGMPIKDTLAIVLETNLDLFDVSTAKRWLKGFVLLLEGIVEQPHARVGDLPFSDAEERRLLLEEWCGDDRAARPRLVLDRYREAVAAGPERLAIEAPDGALTYAELDARSDQLARLLRRRGVGRGDRVGVCTDRSVHLPVAVLAAMKAGAAFVGVDPAYPRQRIAYMLDDAGCRIVLTRRALLDQLPPHDGLLFLDEWSEVVSEVADDATDGGTTPIEPKLEADDLAYVIYTSGSTGRPKGVAVPHGGLANLVAWHVDTYGVTADDRATLLAGTGFDASVWETWPYLAVGASLHVPDLGVRATPRELIDWLVERRISLCFMPTPMGEAALQESWPESVPLRALLVGGSRLHLHRPAGLDFELVNHYGPTENSVVATYHRVAEEGQEETLPPIGRPVDGCRCYVLDESLRPVPKGAVGELYLGGDSLALGYLGRPELTDRSFVPDPFSDRPGARLYRTGDLARFRDDGALEFRGRKDGQVKIRGYRIELGEIEAVLREHPDVVEAAAVPHVHTTGETLLVAYVVAPDEPPTAELRKSARALLPEYMMPSRFVFLDSLPQNANGKIDRAALTELDEYQPEMELVYVAPRNDLERSLAGVLKTVLHVERVGIDDNFFELGGSSLLLTRAQRQIEEQLQIDVPIIELFNNPTVRLLAEHVGATGGHRTAAAPRAEERKADQSKERLRRQRRRQKV